MEFDLLEIDQAEIRCGANGSCVDATVRVEMVDSFNLNCINNGSCTNLVVNLFSANATITCHELRADTF